MNQKVPLTRSSWRYVGLVSFVVLLGVVATIERFRTARGGAVVARDRDGRVVARSPGDGWMTRIAYDPAGRPTTVARHRVGGLSGHEYAASEIVKFTYTALGDHATVPAGSQEFFDRAGSKVSRGCSITAPPTPS